VDDDGLNLEEEERWWWKRFGIKDDWIMVVADDDDDVVDDEGCDFVNLGASEEGTNASIKGAVRMAIEATTAAC